MAEMMETVEHLTTEIGPRPAATEEEQQAALYIVEQFEKTAGLQAEIEEFSGPMSTKKARVLLGAVTLLVTLFSLFFSIMALPAFIVAALCAVVVVLEELGHPLLSNVLDKGVSQNVVARYKPASASAEGSRRRKVILVARTDSGSVQKETTGFLLKAMPVLTKASRIGVVALPVLLLIKAVFFLHATGPVAIIVTLLIVVAMIAVALPVVSFLLSRASGYNDGANSSASGIAVMLEVARRVNGAAGFAGDAPVVHGEKAAYEADAVPEGASLEYEFAPTPAPQMRAAAFVAPAENTYSEPEPQAEADGLMAAKEAIASMTGVPVSSRTEAEIAVEEPVQSEEAPAGEDARPIGVPAAVAAGVAMGMGVAVAADGAAAAAQTPEYIAAPVEATVADSAKNAIPDWFSAGRAAARRTGLIDQMPSNIKRSQFAATLDATESRLGTDPAAALENAYAAPAYTPLETPAAVVVEPTTPLEAAPDETVAMPAVFEAPEAAQPAVELAPRIEMTDFAASPLVAEPSVTDIAMPQEEVAPEVVQPVTRQPIQVPSSVIELEPVAPEAAEPEFSASPEEKLAPIPMDYFMQAAAVIPTTENAANATIAVPVVTDPSATVALPEISPLEAVPTVDVHQQRAPLAQAAEGQNIAKSLLTMLPTISPADSEHPDLRAVLPSLSGSLARISSPDADAPSATGSFAPIPGATGSFAPVTESLLLEASDEEDLIVEDADDSDLEENHTETGAFAGPGYVEMPKKRPLGGLFDKLFHRGDKEEELSTKEWLDVDDDFEARSVGAERGSWESFRDDEYSYEDDDEDDYYEDDLYDDDYYEDDDDLNEEDGRWNGGGFSGVLAGAAEGISGAASRVRGALPKGKQEEQDAQARRSRRHEHQEEEQAYDPSYEEQAAYVPAAHESKWALPASLEQEVYEFRASSVDIEVWFVALGADIDSQAGMKAFLAEHDKDKRGAIVIELDSLGAGELSMVSEGGILRKVTVPSRMRRILNHASQATGKKVPLVPLSWLESASTVAQRAGVQAMHLVGMDGAKPALYAEADDVAENIDEQTLSENAEFVVEVLKNI